MNRTIFTPDFKNQIIQEIKETGSARTVAEKHKINYSTAASWMRSTAPKTVKRKIKTKVTSVATTTPKIDHMSDDQRQESFFLQKLKQENAILKGLLKAAWG